MTLGSPTSPKPTSGAQFLPGFLMGDLPAPATPQPRTLNLAMPSLTNPGTHRCFISGEQLLFFTIYTSYSVLFCPWEGGGGSAPQPVVPTPKDKSGAPPVRSINDDLVNVMTPLNTHRQVSTVPLPKWSLFYHHFFTFFTIFIDVVSESKSEYHRCSCCNLPELVNTTQIKLL